MSKHQGNQTKASNIPSIERASGRSWSDWVTLFNAEDAAKLTHPKIVRIARAALPDSLENPDWWAQGTAIAYEQHAGLRVPGQSSSGDFRVSVSRTLPLDRDEAIERWVEIFGDTPHRGFSVTSVRRSRTEKRSFWRASLDGSTPEGGTPDGGKIEVAAEAKAAGRTLLAVNHTGLTEADHIEDWRAHWKHCLGEI